MKTFIAALLLALTIPTHAKDTKADPPIIRKWKWLQNECVRQTDGDVKKEVETPVCRKAGKVADTLEARGFCLYGHETLAWAPMVKGHCSKEWR